MLLEQHIEELRAELRNAVYRDERREIEVELELACAELAVIMAEQEGVIEWSRPSEAGFAKSSGLTRRIDRRFKPEASLRIGSCRNLSP
ncbi:hypothetical protein [Agrobacterium pusense]|uniref:hypothetical protein n=1 Tax=Agrobacterium pusense TaxID=648995 RepID=UPI00156AD03C|nr:hypothetical protein [Agrobacterium pusense]QKJ94337.1 hypothetical protein HQN82_24760 [Agrobacterium pusense]